jgi:hypothetical protein
MWATMVVFLVSRVSDPSTLERKFVCLFDRLEASGARASYRIRKRHGATVLLQDRLATATTQASATVVMFFLLHY